MKNILSNTSRKREPDYQKKKKKRRERTQFKGYLSDYQLGTWNAMNERGHYKYVKIAKWNGKNDITISFQEENHSNILKTKVDKHDQKCIGKVNIYRTGVSSILGFRGILVILQVLGVFWSFLVFWGILVIFRFQDILVIFWVLGVSFGFWGYLGHFLVLGVFWSFFRFWGYFGNFQISGVFW